MDKPIRKAVRTFIIQNVEVLAIKYLTEKNNGFYMISLVEKLKLEKITLMPLLENV